MRFTGLFSFALLFVVSFTANAQENPINPNNLITESETLTAATEKQQQSFFALVNSGDSDEVKKLLRDSVDYYAHNRDGESALTVAIKNEDIRMVKLLVKDAVINVKNKEGETPLTLAIKGGNDEIIQLICRRAKGSLKNEMGEAPLYLAVENNNLFLMEELIKKGADVNRHSNGITPLAHAVEVNNIRAIGYLIKEGATVNLPNENAETPLYIAIENGFDIAAGILINKTEDPMGDVNWTSKIEETLLNIAIIKTHPEIVRILLDAGAEVTSQDYFENNALHIAGAAGNIEIIKILMLHGISIDERNLKGETALMLASKNNQTDAVHFLVENGANPELRDYTGYAVREHVDVSGVEVKTATDTKSRLSNFQPTKKIEYEEKGGKRVFISNQ
ncbi:MAG: ankyrin repeat protein [Paraglaciecola sp.]|jgi:ankyrin repeat protein